MTTGASNEPKPETPQQYHNWMLRKHGAVINEELASRHSKQLNTTKNHLQASPVWNELNRDCKIWDDEFKKESGFELFAGKPPSIEVAIKDFDSVVEKSFRKNVINNAKWPDPPQNGWMLPDNWNEKMNDILRTAISVRFLDGVIFLSEKIEMLSKRHNLIFHCDMEAKTSGYHALHNYLMMSLPVPDLFGNLQNQTFHIEIQVRTILQETLWHLTHDLYESSRGNSEEESYAWRFRDMPAEFNSTYIGHEIHYLEANIVNLRKMSRGHK